METPVSAEHDSTVEDIESGKRYLSEVNNIEDYGVFVNLTPPEDSDLSGLVHSSQLPMGRETEFYDVGDQIVVELREQNDEGELSFHGIYDEYHIEPQGPMDLVDDPIESAISTLLKLNQNGYEASGYTREIDNDEVTVSVTVSEE